MAMMKVATAIKLSKMEEYAGSLQPVEVRAHNKDVSAMQQEATLLSN